MVQGTRVGLIIWAIVWRFLVFVSIVIISLFLQDPFYSFLINTLHYQEPAGFFGFSPYFFGLGWVLSWMFWSTIVYGTIGSKFDYLFVLFVFAFSLLNFFFTENVNTTTYLGLVGVALLGNALGYMLKVGKERWLGR